MERLKKKVIYSNEWYNEQLLYKNISKNDNDIQHEVNICVVITIILNINISVTMFYIYKMIFSKLLPFSSSLCIPRELLENLQEGEQWSYLGTPKFALPIEIYI